MTNSTLADKMAKKAFESAAFQKNWAGHVQFFGPILESAFVNDYQSRVHLTAALNQISNRNLAQGLNKLNQLQDKCVTDADKAAWLFFMGVFQEMSGNKEQMLYFYTQCNEYGHRFYMPYLKVAKFYLDGHLYLAAEENYRAAIACFTATGLDLPSKRVLGSAYTNLASCLLMMHRYDEAEEALSTSRSLFPEAPGRAAIEAALHAIHGDVEAVDACLAQLKSHAPAMYHALRESTNKILSRTDPLFFPVPVDDGKIAAFWDWFSRYEEGIYSNPDSTAIAAKLLETFPFLEEPPIVRLTLDEECCELALEDLYAVGITHAYKALLAACPEELTENWQFTVIH